MILFNRASMRGNELTYVTEAMSSGKIASDGPFTRRAQGILESHIGGKALLTSSCTDALEMAALLTIKPGDEVIMPAFTFVSTANAFVIHGATPVFCDIRTDTLNIDESLIESLITPKTRAIVVVHYAGVGCEMDAILDIARRHDLIVIEDNAHGLGGTYRGKPLGSFGALSTLSFHETKNLTCGEGGALIVNDMTLFQRAEILRDKGTNRARFFRGEIDKYSWVDVGSSYAMSDVSAAFLCGQLEVINTIQAKRHAIWSRYRAELSNPSIFPPFTPAHCQHPAHMFYLLMPDLAARTALITHLKARGVQATFHYGPLNKSEYGARFGGDCPVTESVADRIVRLPLYTSLTHDEQTHVIESVKSFTL